MDAHLTLRHQGAHRRVDELDRILDRDDVARLDAVDLAHNRSQRRRLARTGRACHQTEAVGDLRQLLHRGRKPQVGHRGDGVGDDPEDRAHAARLLEVVGPKAADPLERVDEVELILRGKAGPLFRRQDLKQEAAGLRLRHGAEGETEQIAIVTDRGDRAGRKVKVAGGLLHDEPQEGVEACHLIPSVLVWRSWWRRRRSVD